MGFRSNNARRFSTAESFRLFMEGLRGLQLNEDESARGDDSGVATTEFPSQAVLTQTLQSAYQNLNECVSQYPDDLLPRYYRGIVLSLQAQDAQAAQLFGYLSHPELLPPTCPVADALLRRAADDFQAVIAEAKGEMRLYAQYNRAQALARLSRTEDWEAALQTLAGMDLDSPNLESLPKWKRFLCRVILYTNKQERMVTTFTGELSRQVGGESGVMASAAKAKAEQTALALQVDLLKSFVMSRFNSQTVWS